MDVVVGTALTVQERSDEPRQGVWTHNFLLVRWRGNHGWAPITIGNALQTMQVDSIYHLCPNFVTRVMDSSIEALDTRLRRLEYILTGSTSTVDTTLKADSQRTNIPNQLSSLNDRLAKLANTNKSIKKLLQACNSPSSPIPF